MGSERGRPEIPPPGRSSSSSRAATSSTGEAPPPEGRGRGRRRAMRARPPGQGRAAARARSFAAREQGQAPEEDLGAADPVELDAGEVEVVRGPAAGVPEQKARSHSGGGACCW
ncbi:uncharacterized protein LOC120645356 [Panicum virgatum]|uniref:uncharacterized protein LOC120645356 n=1 Tax=Panicum virgatum TaxID=38727 RepID=UPI0019D52259|nr:uncharacterized protein LOC120645356 [Panicum virgatum]